MNLIVVEGLLLLISTPARFQFLVAKATQAFTAISNSVSKSVGHTFFVTPHQPITAYQPIKIN